MNQETRYRYEKRIRELREECNLLAHYRTVAIRIYREAARVGSDSPSLRLNWILEQFTELLK